MATKTATPVASPTSFSVTSSATRTGTIKWGVPSLPAGAVISSVILTGTVTVSSGLSGKVRMIISTSKGTTAITGTKNFTLNLSKDTSITQANVTLNRTGTTGTGTVAFSNLKYVITYTIPSYTVTFVDYDGTVLKTQVVSYGGAATAPTNPTRTGYTFSGWNNSYTYITSNTTVTATYAINKYTVTFKDHDGTVLKTQTVNYGSAATAPTNPSRTGYTFTGWDKTFASITANLTVIAQYTINKYTVTFVDYNGTVLKTQEVNYGSAATAPTNPSRTGYTFTGWDKSFSKITANLTVIAQYTINKYTVTFKDHDGTVLKTQEVNYGSSATAPSNPSRTGYTFSGWNKTFASVTSDLTVTALYTINKYTVTFVDYNGTVLKTQTVEYGRAATAPSNPTRDGYIFISWDKAFTSITSDLTITAQYKEEFDTDLRVKENGSWIVIKSAYKKVSGIWVRQINENLDNLFNTKYAYIKK